MASSVFRPLSAVAWVGASFAFAQANTPAGAVSPPVTFTAEQDHQNIRRSAPVSRHQCGLTVTGVALHPDGGIRITGVPEDQKQAVVDYLEIKRSADESY